MLSITAAGVENAICSENQSEDPVTHRSDNSGLLRQTRVLFDWQSREHSIHLKMNKWDLPEWSNCHKPAP